MMCNGCRYQYRPVKTYIYRCKICNKYYCDRPIPNCWEYHKRECKNIVKGE